MIFDLAFQHSETKKKTLLVSFFWFWFLLFFDFGVWISVRFKCVFSFLFLCFGLYHSKFFDFSKFLSDLIWFDDCIIARKIRIIFWWQQCHHQSIIFETTLNNLLCVLWLDLISYFRIRIFSINLINFFLFFENLFQI